MHLQQGLAYSCFFLSGLTGLLYEVCWIRIASLLFGSATFALSTVLAVFFLGIAVGAYLFGRMAQGVSRPLRLYAVLEIAIGILALLSPLAFALIESIYGEIYRHTPQQPGLHFIVRLALISLVMLPPTVLMGGTLPIFCRQLVVNEGRIARGVGLLYGLNTLGAACGCALVGFVLLPTLGTQWSLVLGCLMNVICGMAVWLSPISRQAAPQRLPLVDSTSELKSRSRKSKSRAETSDRCADISKAERPVPQPDIETRWRAWLLFGLVFLVGFCAIGNEIIWTRYLSLLVDNSVHSYTITLTVTLLGIVLGSVVVARFLDARISRSLVFGVFQVALALTVLGLMKTPPAVWQRLGNEFWTNAVLLVVPAIFSGASLPLAVRMAVSQLSEVARGTGQIVAFNTLGGILGSLAVGFVALPMLGLDASLLLLTGISLCIGIAAWIGLDRQSSAPVRAGCVAISLLAWLALAFFSSVKLPQDLLARRGELLDFCEGYNANLALVRSNGRQALRIDGHWQGEAEKTHQIMAAHLPMLLHPAPKQVMVIGIGTGQTASRFAMYPIDREVCVDIEPLLFPFIRKHFPADWMDDPRTRLVAEDGRSYLAHSGDKFDVISLELGQVFRPGVAAFYTVDAYRVIRDRLAEGGLVAQFVPISYFSPEQLRGVVRTFLQVFPESTLWYNRVELLLIGRKGDRLEVDLNAVAARLEGNAAVKSDLQFSPWGGHKFWLNQKVALAGSFLLDQEGLQALAEGGEIYGDDRPVLDYEVSENMSKGRSGQEARILELIVPLLSTFDNHSLGTLSPAEQEFARQIRLQNLGEIAISIVMRQIPDLVAERRFEKIAELLQLALQSNPDHLEANRMLGDALMYSSRFAEAEPYFRIVTAADPTDFQANKGLANSLLRQSRLEESIPYFRAAIAANGSDPDTHNDFGIALARSHRFAEAENEFQAALRINPEFQDAQKNLKRARSDALRSR